MNADTQALIAQAEAHRVAAVASLAEAEAALERARDNRVISPGADADERVTSARGQIVGAQEELATAEAEGRVYRARGAAEQRAEKSAAVERYRAAEAAIAEERAADDARATAKRERLAARIRGAEAMVAEVPLTAAEYEPRGAEDDAERFDRIRAARWLAFDRENERIREPREPG